ncbi:MAG: toprim domain-containing protein [Candidatus Buchananbacteria bacterium]|jgi:hypothetical protein
MKVDTDIDAERQFDFTSHLHGRGLTGVLPGIFIDAVSCRVNFLIYNFSGQIIGVQKYDPFNHLKNNGGRYKTYIGKSPDGQQKIAVWGLQFYRHDMPYVFLTEGIFDAIRIINSGFPALALLSCDASRSTKHWLKILPQKKIAILDSNKAGKKLVRFSDFHRAVPNQYKDLGEMSQTEASTFIQSIVNELNNRNIIETGDY